MEEYLKTLLEQIRCKKAHASIYHEIRGHIEEQVADNIAEGMSKDDALKAALNDMGDPVQTGVEMDQLHRPQMAWRIIVVNRYTDTFQHFDTISRHERYSRQ